LEYKLLHLLFFVEHLTEIEAGVCCLDGFRCTDIFYLLEMLRMGI